MRNLLLFSVFVAWYSSLFAGPLSGDTVFNQTDARGFKQGYWKKLNESGIPVYTGFFKDNKPVGRFVRYYDDGSVSAVLIFDQSGSRAHASMYYNNGNISATGCYINKMKDSTWHFYSYYSKALKATENYLQDMKHGLSTVYYDNGRVSEIKNYVQGKKHGPWEQYYEDGTLRAKCLFRNNTFEGEYITYYPDGRMYVNGTYVNGLKQGKWKYFDDQGQLKSEIEYVNGMPVNLDRLEADELKFFNEIEKMKGKIPEPSEQDFMKPQPDGQ